MTSFDYVAIGIIVLSLLFGLWRGVVAELVALFAWVLGAFAAIKFGSLAGNYVFSSISDETFRMLAGCILVFVGVLVIMALIRMAIQKMLKVLGLTLSDRLLGMFFGMARALLVILVLVGLGGMTEMPKKTWWKEATLAPPFETAVLVTKQWLPENLAKRIRFN